MKISRAISILLYAIAFMVIGSLIYRALFESGGGRSGGFGYGNLWIRYSVEERGVLSPKLQWLIVTPEFPTNQRYEGAEDKFTFTFANGKTFDVHSDSENLIWIDPDEGPSKLSADLTGELLQRIEATRDSARGSEFLSGVDFLTSVQTTQAEQASTGQPATSPESEPEPDDKHQPESEGLSR